MEETGSDKQIFSLGQLNPIQALVTFKVNEFSSFFQRSLSFIKGTLVMLHTCAVFVTASY